jgi:hypothetical protein
MTKILTRKPNILLISKLFRSKQIDAIAIFSWGTTKVEVI